MMEIITINNSNDNDNNDDRGSYDDEHDSSVEKRLSQAYRAE